MYNFAQQHGDHYATRFGGRNAIYNGSQHSVWYFVTSERTHACNGITIEE
jgi:hypothetical protein